jgi:hypothetical protein
MIENDLNDDLEVEDLLDHSMRENLSAQEQVKVSRFPSYEKCTTYGFTGGV